MEVTPQKQIKMNNIKPKKESYYWENVIDYTVNEYIKKRNQDKLLISNVIVDIEKKLKDDPIFTKKANEAMDAENQRLLESKQRGPEGIPEDTRNEIIANWQNSVLVDREENPEKYKQIHEDIANTLRENGTYERNGNTWRERRMQETPEERSARSRHANECMTPETREQIRLSNIKTNAKNKLDNFTKNYYNVIQEEGWFSREDAHVKYQFKGRIRGTALGFKMLGYAFSDCVELGLFKQKYMNVVTLSGGARRMYYIKVVEGKDIDYKSLEDKINSDNDKVRAARLTDEDHLAKRAKTKLNIEKSTAIKNEKRLKKYLSKLPETGITFEMIKSASPNHGWYAKIKSGLEFENQVIGRTGKQITKKCTWKKKLK